MDRTSKAALLGLTALLVTPFATANGGDDGMQTADVKDRQIAFYALSRGRGVPDAARRVLAQVRNHFAELRVNGEVTWIENTRLGLEGETRVCAEFTTTEAALAAWKRIEGLMREVELVQLKAERCRAE